MSAVKAKRTATPAKAKGKRPADDVVEEQPVVQAETKPVVQAETKTPKKSKVDAETPKKTVEAEAPKSAKKEAPKSEAPKSAKKAKAEAGDAAPEVSLKAGQEVTVALVSKEVYTSRGNPFVLVKYQDAVGKVALDEITDDASINPFTYITGLKKPFKVTVYSVFEKPSLNGSIFAASLRKEGFEVQKKDHKKGDEVQGWIASEERKSAILANSRVTCGLKNFPGELKLGHPVTIKLSNVKSSGHTKGEIVAQ
jgi:hypothetical protein